MTIKEKFMNETGKDFFRGFALEMPEFKIDFYLQEGELKAGSKTLQVLHTPGHSPGHVCILVGDILLCGDHILARTIPQQWPESLAACAGLSHVLLEATGEGHCALPVELLAAVTKIGDASCLEPLAAAYADDETLKRMTNEEFAGIMASEDTKEGLTAFIEKRPPNWQGR